MWDAAEQKRIRRTFTDQAEAVGWVRDAKVAIRRGRTLQRPSGTLKAVCEAWLADARTGVVRTRSGDVFKPAAVRSYELALRRRVWPEYGDEPIGDITRADLQALINKLSAAGFSPSTVQTAITALRSVFRREVEEDRLKVGPTQGLRLPAVRGGRERVATPEEAEHLLAALPARDRAVWATAFYAGLRRGELMALRADAIDLARDEIHVLHGWDVKEGEQDTKGRERRKVWLIPTLKTILAEHMMQTGRRGSDFVFGPTPSRPFEPDGRSGLTARADKAWSDAKFNRITLHECRHTFASVAIAAGVNIGAVSAAMGHASVTITWDRYHHLMPGTMIEAGGLIQAYIDRPAA
ncbi:MAG TPA: tyrosine-type recombinase/integrase [Thermoleophilaceae bacterium]|nr:tyrosine-type recombinase/integrase [Thermoleophilaceae bacterium]